MSVNGMEWPLYVCEACRLIETLRNLDFVWAAAGGGELAAGQTCLEASAEIVLLYLNDDRVIEMRGVMWMWERERQLMIDECIVIQLTACSAAASLSTQLNY